MRVMTEPLSIRPLLPNDHRSPGHVHRWSYAGDGCEECDRIFLTDVPKHGAASIADYREQIRLSNEIVAEVIAEENFRRAARRYLTRKS